MISLGCRVLEVTIISSRVLGKFAFPVIIYFSDMEIDHSIERELLVDLKYGENDHLPLWQQLAAKESEKKNVRAQIKREIVRSVKMRSAKQRITDRYMQIICNIYRQFRF